ncbi:MAG: protein-disulfide reductase DsbD domain-containing protein [Bacteroidota bacterium]
MSAFCLMLLLKTAALFGYNQQSQPVKWTFDAEKTAANEYDITFTADAESGWYVYSQFLEDGGPIPTSFNFDDNQGVELVGKAREIGKKKEGFDKLFEMKVISFSGKTKFVQKIKTPAGATSVKGFLEFMTCNGETCLPPTEVTFNIPLQ